jgi:hypothetical protein
MMINGSIYTGCPKSPVPISFSIFSTIIFDRINFFFLKDRPIHKALFHKKKSQKYCSKVSPSTEIQKLSLFFVLTVHDHVLNLFQEIYQKHVWPSFHEEWQGDFPVENVVWLALDSPA